MISSLHALGARITGVYKFVLALRMQLKQQGHCGVLAASKARKFIMPLPGHGQKGIPPVHQFTRHGGIGVGDGAEAGGRLGRVQPDGEEDVLVLLHGGVDLLGEVGGRRGRGLFRRGLSLGRRLFLFNVLLLG